MILQSHPSGDAWLVIAGPSSMLALPAADDARVAELTTRLVGAEGFRAALESLVGGGIASAPPFALLDGDSTVLRVVLRGEAAVTATVAGVESAFSGAGMATWTERVLEGATALRLTVPGSTWSVMLDAPGNAASGPAEATLAPRAEHDAPAAEGPAAPAAKRPKDPVSERDADDDETAYDFLFGDTIYRTQAGASIRIPNPDPDRPGDHDGQTMLADDLGLAGRTPAQPEHSAPSLPLGPTLKLERLDGSRESLSRPVLIGRSPAAGGTAGGGPATGSSATGSSSPEPRLITVLDDPDISRTHLRVAVEGDVAVVTDLGSKNGTLITLPGSAPRKLRAAEPTVVLPGTLIDLGGGTVFTVRED